MKDTRKKPAKEIDRESLLRKKAEKSKAIKIRNKRKQKINERS